MVQIWAVLLADLRLSWSILMKYGWASQQCLAGQLLPGAGLDNCELNCTEFRFIVYWSVKISQNKVKKSSGEDQAVVCIVSIV